MEEDSIRQSFFADHPWLLEAPGQQPTPASSLRALEGIACAISEAVHASTEAEDRVANVSHTDGGQPISTIRGKLLFAGAKVPPISLRDYLIRIWNYTKVSPICMLIAFTYVDALCARLQCQLTRLTAHRLLLIAVLLAAKSYEDTIYNNVYFAKVGGVSVAELNTLEVEMLKLLDFRLLVDIEEIRKRLIDLEAGNLALCEDLNHRPGSHICYGV